MLSFGQKGIKSMATKNKQGKKKSRAQSAPPVETERAPAGRGGVAMGRTVGLPFGGARPRKRKANNKRGASAKS